MDRERADRIVESAFAAYGLKANDCDIVDIFKVREVCLKVVELVEIECQHSVPSLTLEPGKGTVL